jgi:hypothetical protein
MFVLSEMDKLNIQSLIIEMQKQQVQLQQLQTFILQESFQRQIPEYVSLKEAAQLKGVTSYENLQKKPWHQPCCGTRIVRLNGHRCWKRQDIIEWLAVNDSNLEEYARRMNVDISRHFLNGRNI